LALPASLSSSASHQLACHRIYRT